MVTTNPNIFIIKKNRKNYLLVPESLNLVQVSDDILLLIKNNKIRRIPQALKKILYTNKILIQRNSLKKGSSKSLGLKVTSGCNFNCSFCSQKDIPSKKEEMSWDTAKKAIDQYTSPPNEVNLIGFFGGEPLLNAHLIKKCIKYAKATCLQGDVLFEINTNGWFLEKNLSWLDNKNILIAISIQGDKNYYNHLKELEKYNRIYTAIKKFRNKDNLVLSIFLDYSNINCIKNVFKEFKEIGINKFALCIPSFQLDKYWGPIGNGSEIAKKVLNLFKIAHKRGIKLVFSNWGFWSPRNANCRSLSGDSFFVNTNGNIDICHSIPYKLGNIKITKLEKMNTNFPKYIKQELKFCSSCSIHAFCKGGCLADRTHKRKNDRLFCIFAKEFFKLYINYLIGEK